MEPRPMVTPCRAQPRREEAVPGVSMGIIPKGTPEPLGICVVSPANHPLHPGEEGGQPGKPGGGLKSSPEEEISQFNYVLA